MTGDRVRVFAQWPDGRVWQSAFMPIAAARLTASQIIHNTNPDGVTVRIGKGQAQ